MKLNQKTIKRTKARAVQITPGLLRMIKGKRVGLPTVKALMQEIRGFIVPVEVENVLKREQRTLVRDLRELKSRHDGATLAEHRKIVVPAKFDPQTKKWILGWGCYQESSVLQAALKALETRSGMTLNPRMMLFPRIGTRPHITVFFDYKGITYEADVFNNTLMVADQIKKRTGINLGERILTFKELAQMQLPRVEEFPLGI
jgi:hypothetical protein